MTARIQMVFGLLLILLGGLIYLSFRPTTLLLFHALDRMGLMLLITDWRAWMSAYQPTEFVLYSLPGGLWAAAYILIILSLTGRPLNSYNGEICCQASSTLPTFCATPCRSYSLLYM